ncbi:hypothetical protein QLX08_004408 [Tetragonisca angustula]|uniref:Uncharacterized protein n=1 Tax=Tetragonisca angustula TaxID=166442 RepID=A0AAW1A2T2_9HYME
MYANDTEKFSSSLSIDRGGLGLSRCGTRGGHVKPKKSESAGLASKPDSPNYPDFPEKPAFTGVIWEKARPQIAFSAVIYPSTFFSA